jgi:uncharacterized protein DUF6745
MPKDRRQPIAPATAADADHLAAECISAYLSTEPVDEEETEALLRRAYAAARLEGPGHIHWLDGPLQLVAVLGREDHLISVDDDYRDRVPHCVWDDIQLERQELALMGPEAPSSLDYRIRRVAPDEEQLVNTLLRTGAPQDGGWDIWSQVARPVRERVRDSVGDRIWRAVGDASNLFVPAWIRDSDWDASDYTLWHSICAYDEAMTMAMTRFYGEHVRPNAAGALTRFNERVSGYWLGKALALLVRKPIVLSRDERDRLHSATGPCVQYADGWGLWAWHGVRVPAWVIERPVEKWTRADFFNEPNIEVRRVIQERMGERFVWEIGARFVDAGPRGTLYEVNLPGDPDRVARYLLVADPSTGRDYYLRVPPTVQTAAEAAAWTFGLTATEYQPARET